LKSGFIGAGRIGCSLAKYFEEKGSTVSGVYSRSGGLPAEEVVKNSEILFLTVPDSAIADVWDDVKKLPIEDKIICHTSGALSSDVFAGIEKLGAYGYSVHPFLAFSSKNTDVGLISRTFFTIEGSEKRLDDVKCLIECLGNSVRIIDKSQKAKYHAAAVFLSNHVTAIAQVGCNVLKGCGLDDEFTHAALNTIFLGNAGKVAETGTVNSLTGPVERNDVMTVKKHIDALENSELKIYKLLTRELIKIAGKKHKSRDYSEMKALL